MPRDINLYLQDIKDSIAKIMNYTEGYDMERFRADSRTVDAVIRNLEVIGEAAKKLPEEVKIKDGPGEWRKITGLREILSHEYFGIDSEMIWDIVARKLPGLSNAVERIQIQEAVRR